MNNRKITTRRNPSAGKKGKVIRAITKREPRKRKHRAVASATANFSDDEKSLSSKVISVLFVLLVFHICAVGAIIVHNKFIKGNFIETEKVEPALSPTQQKGAMALIQEEKSKISKNERYTIIRAGETYQSIAARENVDLKKLKSLNRNRPIKAGESIKVPISNSRSISVISPELQAVKNAPQSTVEKVTPNVYRIVEKEQPKKVVENFAVHTFQKGDTLWSLSKKYNVALTTITKANPDLNPNAISAGQKIKIPKS